MFNNSKYHLNIIRIKFHDYISCNIVGSPEGIQYYSGKIKRIAEDTLPLIKNYKKRKNLQKIIDSAENTINNVIFD